MCEVLCTNSPPSPAAISAGRSRSPMPWCSPALPTNVSVPFGPRTFKSRPSLSREPTIDAHHSRSVAQLLAGISEPQRSHCKSLDCESVDLTRPRSAGFAPNISDGTALCGSIPRNPSVPHGIACLSAKLFRILRQFIWASFLQASNTLGGGRHLARAELAPDLRRKKSSLGCPMASSRLFRVLAAGEFRSQSKHLCSRRR
jgi:hypothetical protein